jgi:hypothetical protein
MADVNLTSPVTDGDTVTAQTLHDLIETATISGLTAADLSRGAQVILSDSAAPDASEYSYWWDNNHWDPVLRVYARPFNIWLAVGPDRFEFPLQASEPIFKGAVLVSAGASMVGIATGATLNVVGFAQDSAASGAWVPVATCGIGWVAGDPQADAASMEVFTAVGADAGKVVTANWLGASTPTSVVALGSFIDDPRDGQTWTGASLHGFRAFLWGPKSSVGFG